jgi:hypothetical protein
MLGIGRTYFENIRNRLINNGLISRVHGNIKRMVINHNVATAVKNYLENYAEIHGLPSPRRSVNRITQSITVDPCL